MRPQVEYASSIWNPYTKQNINKIEMIQRRAARWVKNNYSPYDSVSNMLDGLGWRSLENRRIDSRLVMFYRIIQATWQYKYQHILRNPSDTLVICTLSVLDRSILLQHTISSHFTQLQLFFGIDFHQTLFLGLILTPSKKESVRSIISPHKPLTLFLT